MPPDNPPSDRVGLAERYRVLLDIGRSLTGMLTREELYRAIYKETAQVLEASGFFIALHDPARDLATVVFYADQGREREVEISYTASDSEVIRSGRATMVEDRATARPLLVLGEEGSEITRSAISAPIRLKDRILGVISAQSYLPNAYGPADLELLQGIADIAAVALENARFVAALDRQRQEAEQVEEIGRAVTGSLDREEVLGKVIDAVLHLVRSDAATVWLLDGTMARVGASGGEAALPRDLEWDMTGEVHSLLVEERSPLVIDDARATSLVPQNVKPHLQTRSGLAVPLIVGSEVVGALSAGSRDLRLFTAEDIRVMRRLASQASVALQNARLHERLQGLYMTDALTGLPNRRHLEMHLGREVAAARRGRRLIGIMFDLDNFKQYNDANGHLAGDEALRRFGRILAEENRAMNLVARYGGDEFFAAVSDSDEDGARQFVERVDRRVTEDDLLGPGGMSVSTGMAPFDPEGMESIEELIEAADVRLYESKARRKGAAR